MARGLFVFGLLALQASAAPVSDIIPVTNAIAVTTSSLQGNAILGSNFNLGLNLELPENTWWNVSSSNVYARDVRQCGQTSPCDTASVWTIVQAGFSQCSTCQAGATFQASACSQQADTVCSACTTCGLGQQQTSACTVSANTVCAACAAVEHSSFKTAGSCEFACDASYYKSSGSCKLCATCDATQYQVSACSAEADTVCAVKGALGQIASIDHLDVGTTGRVNFASLPFTFSASSLLFVGPPSWNGPDACVVRVKREGTSYRVWLAEAKNHDVWHTTESTSWLAVEPGQGSGYFAGSIALAGSNSWKTVTLPATLGKRPWVFQLVQSTNNGADPNMSTTSRPNNLRGYVKTRMSLDSSLGTSFKLWLESCEACGSPVEETVGYLAVDSGCSIAATDDNTNLVSSCPNKVGSITLGGVTYDTITGVTRTTAGTHILSTINFGRTFKTAPVVLANMQTHRGPNPSELRTKQVTTTQFQFVIDEDTNNDAERWHMEELVAFFAIGNFA